MRNEIVEAIQSENVGCDPSHPYLLEIDWIRHQTPTLFSRLGGRARPVYDLDSCPVAQDVLRRQICIEVGPGLYESDMRLTATAISRVLHYCRRGAP
jgi:perosamine synthetase